MIQTWLCLCSGWEGDVSLLRSCLSGFGRATALLRQRLHFCELPREKAWPERYSAANRDAKRTEMVISNGMPGPAVVLSRGSLKLCEGRDQASLGQHHGQCHPPQKRSLAHR